MLEAVDALIVSDILDQSGSGRSRTYLFVCKKFVVISRKDARCYLNMCTPVPGKAMIANSLSRSTIEA